jgi:hypothetical protein
MTIRHPLDIFFEKKQRRQIESATYAARIRQEGERRAAAPTYSVRKLQQLLLENRSEQSAYKYLFNCGIRGRDANRLIELNKLTPAEIAARIRRH